MSAYLRFQESLVIYNTIAGGLGIRYKRRCGIPQGDPVSMLAAALIMRPWTVMMRKKGGAYVIDVILPNGRGESGAEESVCPWWWAEDVPTEKPTGKINL